MRYRIGIDLGGTNIAVGFINERYEIATKASAPTTKNRCADEITRDIAGLVHQIMKQEKLTMNDVESIGIGVPGTANKESGCIEYANNLQFDNFPIVNKLKQEFNKPVFIDNDGNAAAWGEFLAGAGKDKNCQSLIAVTLGTGVGGGIVLNNNIYQGINYGAAEFGHMVIDYRGEECNCGRRGCFEAYASATALISQTLAEMDNNKNSILWELCGNDLGKINGKLVFDAVRSKDSTAQKIAGQYIRYVAIGITNIINIFQPDTLCIGGGISKAGELFIEPLKNIIYKEIYTRASIKQTQILIAALDNDAGIIGAALLAN